MTFSYVISHRKYIDMLMNEEMYKETMRCAYKDCLRKTGRAPDETAKFVVQSKTVDINMWVDDEETEQEELNITKTFYVPRDEYKALKDNPRQYDEWRRKLRREIVDEIKGENPGAIIEAAFMNIEEDYINDRMNVIFEVTYFEEV